jgi:transcriptional regulator with XRE-family HTH domain
MRSRDILSRNLQLLRAARGLSQEALADAAGIDRTYVSSLERQKYSASVDRLDLLAEQLGVASYVLLMPELPTGALQPVGQRTLKR